MVAVSGDGFYMYSVANAAIASAVRYRAPFLSVIYQNRSYSTGTRATAQFYPDGYAVRGGLEAGYFDPPIDFAKEAEAAGAYGENVKDPAQVGPALQRGLAQIRTRHTGGDRGLAAEDHARGLMPGFTKRDSRERRSWCSNR